MHDPLPLEKSDLLSPIELTNYLLIKNTSKANFGPRKFKHITKSFAMTPLCGTNSKVVTNAYCPTLLDFREFT